MVGRPGDGEAGDLIEVSDDLRGERVDGARGEFGIGGIYDSGDGITNWHNEQAVQLVLRWQGEDAERLEDLAEAFVVEEEEELVVNDGAAEVHAELVAVEGGLAEGDGCAGIADGEGLEEAGGVEVGVADEFVEECRGSGWIRSARRR